MLSPFQTPQERQLKRDAFCFPPIWRTCYKPELEDAYNELVHRVQESVDDEDEIYHFNNAELYETGNWEHLVTRIPEYFDRRHDGVEADKPNPEDWSDEEWPLIEADDRYATVVFVVDEEAMKEGVVKVM